MKGFLTPIPDANFKLKSFSTDVNRGYITAFAVLHGTHSVDGRVPATKNKVAADYVYAMEFDGDKIRQITKIWNDGHSLKRLGWA